MLFLFPSNKKTKVKMKIKAKKTNSASENAIRSSYFVVELRKLSTSSLKLKIQTCTALFCRVFAYSNEPEI